MMKLSVDLKQVNQVESREAKCPYAQGPSPTPSLCVWGRGPSSAQSKPKVKDLWDPGLWSLTTNAK